MDSRHSSFVTLLNGFHHLADEADEADGADGADGADEVDATFATISRFF